MARIATWKVSKTYSGLGVGTPVKTWVNESNPKIDRIIQINLTYDKEYTGKNYFIIFGGKTKDGDFVFVDKLPGRIFRFYPNFEMARKDAVAYMRATPVYRNENLSSDMKQKN